MSDNNESNTVMWNALTKRRAEMILDIEQGEKRVAELKAQLLHLDATLRIFRPDFAEAGLPVRHRRRTKSPYFEHGELTERIYDALRGSESVATSDIGAKAMRDKGLDPDHDRATRTDFVRRMTLRMREMAVKGEVEHIGGRGPASRWRLKK